MSKMRLSACLVTVSSTLGDQQKVGEKTNFELMSKLGENCSENLGVITSLKSIESIKTTIKEADLLVLSVATGGTEKLIRGIIEELTSPVLLIPTFKNNSFASSLEAYSKVKNDHRNVRLIFNKSQDNIEQVGIYFDIVRAIKMLHTSRLGIVGGVSPWVITSTIDKQLVRDRLGVRLEKIQMKEFIAQLQRIKSVPKNTFLDVMKKFSDILEPKNLDLIEAIKVYLALKKMMQSKALNSITLRCFDLIEIIENTACLALSLLNDDGVIAGCEGDVDAVLTMMILSYVSNQPSFMANINEVDVSTNTIYLSHCTVSSSISENAVLRSHFESKLGVAIQGKMPIGTVTVCRIGEKFGKMIIFKGDLLENLNYPERCRTQIRVKVHGSVKNLIQKTFGNHHVLVTGDHIERIIEFCRLKNIEQVLLKDDTE